MNYQDIIENELSDFYSVCTREPNAILVNEKDWNNFRESYMGVKTMAIKNIRYRDIPVYRSIDMPEGEVRIL